MGLVIPFITGGIIYGLVELIYRRRTHWTMIITGGFCFSFLYLLGTKSDLGLFARCVLGALFITAAEYTVGCIVNLRFRLNVWDYSGNKYNISGQICPMFMLYWFLLCFPAMGLVRLIEFYVG